MEPWELPETGRLAGIATTAELVASGLAVRDIRALVRRGVLVGLGRGVYAKADMAASLTAAGPRGDGLLRAAAAVAVCRQGTVLSHVDAALAYGLALLDRPEDGVVTVTRSPRAGGCRTARPGIPLHMAALPSRHVAFVAQIPVTSVERTVVDLARALPFAAGVVTADSALYLRKTTAGRLHRVLGDCARWPGITKAAQVVAFSHPLAESPLESLSRVAFRDGGLPPPVLQAWIAGEGRAIGRVDFLWKEQRTIAEADGAMKYADPDRARLQWRRDTELREAGYEVVHFTWRDITARPEHVIAQIKAAFTRSARLRDRPRGDLEAGRWKPG